MRIFCNDISKSEATIADFLGKNIWVRCLIKEYSLYRGTRDTLAYIRFIRKSMRLYDCNILPESDIGHYTSVSELGISSLSIDHVFIISTLETKTTEELFGEDITAHNAAIFKRFENKPYWIHVTSECLSDWWDSYYIQIDKLDGIVMEGRCYKDYHVDFYESKATTEDVEYDEYPSEMYEHFILTVDTFRIQEPLDLLSDREIREILNDNDYLYESLCAELDAENDEGDDEE